MVIPLSQIIIQVNAFFSGRHNLLKKEGIITVEGGGGGSYEISTVSTVVDTCYTTKTTFADTIRNVISQNLPPGSKSETLRLGVHLILLYFIMILS